MTHELVWRQVYTSVVSLILFCVALCRDVRPVIENYLPDYSYYHNLSAITDHLLHLVDAHPRYLHLLPSFTSRENRSQLVIHMTDHAHSFTADNRLKIPILFSFGEHAREFLPVESLFDLIHNISDGVMDDELSSAYRYSVNILRSFDTYIIAVANPDGRAYIERTKNHCWRGNSRGVDLNRNFAWQFGQEGSSADLVDEEYRGSAPHSEKETGAFTNLTSRVAFTAFISFHSGIRHIYIPFCDRESLRLKRRPSNHGDMLSLAEVISTSTKNQYKYGTVYDLIKYTAAGTVIDYMAGVRKIPFSLALELWGEDEKNEDRCFDLFNPRSQELQAVVRTLRPIYVSIFQFLITWSHRHVDPLGAVSQDALHSIDLNIYDPPSLTFSYLLLVAVVVVVIVVAIKHRVPCKLRPPSRHIVSLRSLGSTLYSSSSLLKST